MDSIAAIVNLHQEGETALPSIISAWRAVETARRNHIDAELVLIVDSPDAATVKTAARWHARGARVISTNVADLGAARNTAAREVQATWLAFLDADDLWGEDWLVAAHQMATASSASEGDVFHPQVNIIFGDHHSLLHHIDSDGPEFRWSRFSLHNAWTALSFVRRKHLLSLPYPRNDLANGFGFEDWSWNMAVLDSGGRHRVVPDTCHFIKRSKIETGDESLLARSQQSLRSRHPNVPSPKRTVDQLAVNADVGTHDMAPVELSGKIFNQIQLATSIEPTVTKTLSSKGFPTSLPQNFNTHNTAPQIALEELWRMRDFDAPEDATIGEICDRSTLLTGLGTPDRVRVVAEFILSEQQLGRTVGESSLISEATAAFSQLTSAP